MSSESESGGARESLAGDIDQMRKIGEEGLDDLRELGGQIRRRIEDEVKNRPFLALGVAFGAGAVVSSIVTSRMARLAILAAGGYAAREMFGDRLMEVLGQDEGEERERPRRPREKEESKSPSH
jgi:hypothetical protein